VAAVVIQITALLAIAATNEASNPVTAIAYVAMPVLALFGVRGARPAISAERRFVIAFRVTVGYERGFLLPRLPGSA